MNNRIEIIDTTLRDGQQSPLLFDNKKYRFSLDEKKTIIDALNSIGVRYIELFSPVVGGQEEKDIKELIDYIHGLNSEIKILAHVRCHSNDIQSAIVAGFDGLNMYISTSDIAIEGNHKKDIDSICELVKTLVVGIKVSNPEISIRFSAEDAFRSNLNDVYKIIDGISEEIDRIGLPDTVGMATPENVNEVVRQFRLRYPNLDIECHFHNDRDLSVINSITAVRAGAKFISSSIWGLAERSGITSITSLLLNLFYEDPRYISGYNLGVSYPLNITMGTIMDMMVPHNEPVSLTNRTHVAGVHHKAVLQDNNTYEGSNLGDFGVAKTKILLGPLSGWNTIYYYMKEAENFIITKNEAKGISKQFKEMSNMVSDSYSASQVLVRIAEEMSLKKRKNNSKYNSLRTEFLG